ncbi:flagellin N-terminal helical domain-containing protein [Bacillus cereus]|uniref:flagellin N-terminal helical domain-containing protein n=1 Tax=Bacillus TaxID=1386 RepID=UPI00122F0FE6|nr:flagellin [Bacillus cereus]KAA2396405.1 flagellin [Bacillus cereus]MDA1810318.1 flagellin [Bacillus cereus]
MRINTNINSLRTQEYMRQNQAKMSNSMDRLSSGKRINNASDDAAGLAIATRMRARESGLNVAANNTQDGMSLIRTADSALNSVSNILLRMRDLANQSASETNTDKNQAAMQKEFEALKEQIDYIANNTQFNDTNLLDASAGTSKEIKIQTLDSDQSGTKIGIKLQGANLTALGINDLKIGTDKLSQAQLDNATNTMKRLETPSSDAGVRDLDVQAAKDAFEQIKNGYGASDKAAMKKAFDDYTNEVDPANKEALATEIHTAFGKLTTAGTDTIDSNLAIGKIDSALKLIADNRATLGATLNRLDFNVNNLKSQASSMASAASQVEDADMAKEMSEMTKFKILNEAGISMLSQANQTPQMVSKLLQ